MKLPATVADTIHRRELIRSADTVLVAVSGGPDSVALLHCLLQLGYNVQAAHLNHQFRGQEASEDAHFVASLCKSLSVKLTTESIDVPKLQQQQRVSAQQAARAARYKFLEQVRIERNLDQIATAHNLDDRVETVLINILRGSGVEGLKGIPYRRGKIVRPLLDTPRSDVEAYCETYHLSPRTDSSNKLSKYARNNVRSELLPYLERRYNSGVRESLLRLSEIAADESEYINLVADQWLAGEATISVARFNAESIALQRRILREWIRSQVSTELSDVSHTLLEQFRKNVASAYAVTLPGAKFVVESDGSKMIIRPLTQQHQESPAPTSIALDEVTVFGEYLVTVGSVSETVDRDTLHIRTWLDGDRIALQGGTKKVQDVFTDRKIPRDCRRQYPLIADNLGLVSIGDIAIAVRALGSSITVAKVE